MPLYTASFRSSDICPPLIRARNITDALTWARDNATLRDGRRIADLSRADLAGNLYVETPRGVRHYYQVAWTTSEESR